MNQTAFDVVIVAGQSNAAGTGVGPVSVEYTPTENIMMLTDRANPRFLEASGGGARFVINYPTPMHLAVAEEVVDTDGIKRGKFQLSFAKAYYEQYLQGTDRKLLLIYSGVGGTGFCRKEWGTEGAILYDRLVRMTDYALSLNPENRLTAFLWHQGECDSFENPDWSREKRYTVHKQNLSAMLDAFCKRFCCPELPVIAAGFCREWYEKYKQPCDAVLQAIRETVSERSGAFVDTFELKSNNEQTGNGDDIHFSRESLYRLGMMYFEAFAHIRRTKSKNSSQENAAAI